MKKTNILEKIGLTTEQGVVYKALLEFGSQSPSDLVSKTGLHRPVVYKVLPELIDMGLVSVMPKGKYKIYIAESPKRLEKIFENIEDEFNAEIFHLHEAYDTRGRKPLITFAEGDKAIVSLFGDIVNELKVGDTYYRYSPRLRASREKLVPRNYRSLRDKKQLERLVITDASSFAKNHKKLGRSIRAVPDELKLFDEDVTQVIFGNKVAIVDYNTKTVVTIENAMIAAFQKKLFKIMYTMLGK